MSGTRYLLVVLLIGLAGANGPVAQGRERADDRGSANEVAAEGAVRFDLYYGSMMVVRGSIGTVGNLNFLVDTGVSSTVVDTRLARKLDLPEMPISIAVLGGNAQGGEAVLPTLKLGP